MRGGPWAIASALMTVGCADTDMPVGAGDVEECVALSDGACSLEPARVVLDEVRYVLAWDRGATQADDGTTLIVNDLGWRVQLHRGSFTMYVVSLVPCPYADDVSVFRGHGGFTDPSATDAPYIEDMGVLSDISFDPRTFIQTAYCDVHMLAGRANDDAVGLVDDDTQYTSLTLEATVTAPDGRRFDFNIQSDAADGEIVPLSWPADIEPEGTRGTLTITRHLETMFDGIDFANEDEIEEDEDELARAILANLTRDATISLVLER